MSVTAQFLLQGVVYALEQCGLLLRDANILYRSGSYASTLVLTAFAREELGRYRILLDLWRRSALAGEDFTIDQIKNLCDDHLNKQEAGMLSSTLRANKDSGLGKILNAKFTNHPRSQEWQEAGAQLNRIDETMRKRTPSERHNRRKSALYVEPLSETNWNRPASTLKSEARDFLMDAVNDYAGPHERFQPGSPILMATDPELYQALQGWPDRPALPATEWPMAS